jgi:ribosomal protein L44E
MTNITKTATRHNADGHAWQPRIPISAAACRQTGCKSLYSIGGGLQLDGRKPGRAATILGMSAGFHIDKLSDEFGQYSLVLKCAECGHERKAEPLTLGRLCGWDARLEDVAKRMRCSKCGKKRCTLKAFPPKKPRGYTALPR